MISLSASRRKSSLLYLFLMQTILFALLTALLTIRFYNRVNSIFKSLVVISALIVFLVVIESIFLKIAVRWLHPAGLRITERSVLAAYFFKTGTIVMTTFMVINFYRKIPISVNLKYHRVISILGLSIALFAIPFSTFYAVYLMTTEYGRCGFFCKYYVISTPISKFSAPYIIAIFLALYLFFIVHKISKSRVAVKIAKNSMYMVQYILFIPTIYIILFERWQKYRESLYGESFDYVEFNSVTVMGILTLLCYFSINIMLAKANTNTSLTKVLPLLLFPVSMLILIAMVIFGYKPTGGPYFY